MLQNTFQLIVATDGISSYVLFLYDNLEWSQTDSSSGSGSGTRGSGGISTGVSGSGLNLGLVN